MEFDGDRTGGDGGVVAVVVLDSLLVRVELDNSASTSSSPDAAFARRRLRRESRRAARISKILPPAIVIRFVLVVTLLSSIEILVCKDLFGPCCIYIKLLP